MKIFPTTSIKQLDADTIKNEPIASIDLMERASRALARAIAERWEPVSYTHLTLPTILLV